MARGSRDLVFPSQRLERFIVDILTALGLPDGDARTCAARMTEADLRGVDTHGIFRLPQYCRRIRAGGSTSSPTCGPCGRPR